MHKMHIKVFFFFFLVCRPIKELPTTIMSHRAAEIRTKYCRI